MQAISQCWQRREEVESTSHVTHVSPLAVLRNDRNTLWWEPHPGTSGQGELSGHEMVMKRENSGAAHGGGKTLSFVTWVCSIYWHWK